LNVEKSLREAATAAARNAYAPYSCLHVGAALLSGNGNVYSGCNVENGAFPIGLCAERAAIAAAVLAEGAEFRLQSIAVLAFDQNGRQMAVTPCGACRQAMIEFGEDATVAFSGGDGVWTKVQAADLLPHRFALPEQL